MNRRIVTLVAAGAAAAFALAMPLSAAPKGTNHNNSGVATTNCGDDNTLTIRAPEKLWPPNHKYYTDISVTADDGGDNGNITLGTAGTHDGYDGDTGTETNGSGNTADDITTNGENPAFTTTSNNEDGETVAHAESGDNTVVTNWQARAERSGRIKEGRTYRLDAVATFNDGGSSEDCTATATFHVPHDMRPSNR